MPLRVRNGMGNGLDGLDAWRLANANPLDTGCDLPEGFDWTFFRKRDSNSARGS